MVFRGIRMDPSDPNNINRFEVGYHCIKKLPRKECKQVEECKHSCTIYYKNKKISVVDLTASQIYQLIQDISKEKIFSAKELDHFEPPPQAKRLTTVEILTEISKDLAEGKYCCCTFL